MRASPAFQVSLQRFGVWRIAVSALAVLGVAVMTAWLINRTTASIPMTSLAAAVSALGALAAVVSLAYMPPVDLRWDGQLWHLGPATGDALPGDLHVAIDLGTWILLRFEPTAQRTFSRGVWLPAQRRGLESQWHALRCAVYSPRTARSAESPATSS